MPVSPEHPTVPPQTSAQDEAAQAQFTIYDYGRRGDQRPYQVVQPAYGAPQFLKTFTDLKNGMRECLSLCALKGQPFRLMRWGSPISCYPCGPRIRDNRFPSLAITSRGALKGYPEAKPIFEANPDRGVIVYGPKGDEKLVGKPNYAITAAPVPPTGIYNPGPITKKYGEAIHTAMYLANRQGKRTYLCAGFGSSCKGRGKKWFPVVYVDPGGLVARYPYQRNWGDGTVKGSTTISTPVSPGVFRELLAESRGATYLGQGH